jgi:very-short-patch-repair endonuclease
MPNMTDRSNGQAATREFRVLTRADAREIGIPVTGLLGPGYTKLFYDTYVPSTSQPTLHLRAAAALRVVTPGAHVSHHTAVELWGGVAPPTSRVHLTFGDQRYRSQREGIAAHHTPLATTVTRRRGIPISSPTQALLDLASAGVELVDLVVAGDSLVKATGAVPADFVRAAESWNGNRARVARRAARLIREGVDSPMETKLRLLLIFAGLPEPTVNFILRTADGEWAARFDLCYEKWKLIIEYDGRQHAFDSQQWSSDIERREALDRLGWRLVVVRSEDVYRDPERTLRRVRDALVERGAVRSTAAFDTEWSRHFPPRARW